MRTISNSEFCANPEMWFDMAREHDEVRVMKGRDVFHIVCESATPQQPVRQPDEKLRNAISAEELLRRFDERLKQKWAERRK